jgi:hypothetical protein
MLISATKTKMAGPTSSSTRPGRMRMELECRHFIWLGKMGSKHKPRSVRILDTKQAALSSRPIPDEETSRILIDPNQRPKGEPRNPSRVRDR